MKRWKLKDDLGRELILLLWLRADVTKDEEVRLAGDRQLREHLTSQASKHSANMRRFPHSGQFRTLRAPGRCG